MEIRLFFRPDGDEDTISSIVTDADADDFDRLLNTHMIGATWELHVDEEFLVPGLARTSGSLSYGVDGNLFIENEFFKAITFKVDDIRSINFKRQIIRLHTAPTYTRRYEKGSEPWRTK